MRGNLRNKKRIAAMRKRRYHALSVAERKRVVEYQREWVHKQGPRYRSGGNKAFRERVKAEVFSAYGNKCACCGETEPKFLSVDHKQNDGAEERKIIGRSPHRMRLSIRKRGFPNTYQLLCFNCNCGKRDNNGVCPHKTSGVQA